MSTKLFQDYRVGDKLEITLQVTLEDVYEKDVLVRTTGGSEHSFYAEDDDVDSVELVKPAPIPHEERAIGSLWRDPETESRYVRVDPERGDWKYLRYQDGPGDHFGPVLYPGAQEDEINRLVPA